MAYNSSGQGPAPKRNTSQVGTLARPKSTSGDATVSGAGPVSANKSIARPGGATKTVKGGGKGSIARPGGAQSCSK